MLLLRIRHLKVKSMVIKYDKEADVVYLQFTENEVYESDEERQGIIIDYDVDGNIVGIEYLNASVKMENPDRVEFEIQ